MTLKDFREISRIRAYSNHARKYDLLIDPLSMIALLDYVDALERAVIQRIEDHSRQLNGLQCHCPLCETNRAGLAKGEVEI